jgi:hypothetical protein
VVLLSTARSRAYLAGNVVYDGGANAARQHLVEVRNCPSLDGVTGAQNWLSAGFSDLNGTRLDPSSTYLRTPGESPGFVAPEMGDWRLSRKAPLGARREARIEIGLPTAQGSTEKEPLLRWQYHHPAGREPRPGRRGRRRSG